MTHETVDVTAQPAMRSRRDFLKLSGMTTLSVGGLMLLAGCGPAPQDDGGDAAADGDATAHLGDGKTLRVGMEAAYAPYNWQVSEESDFTVPIENVDGAYADGYDVQVAKIIAEGLDMDAVAVKLEFGSLIDALNNGQVDIVCAGMSVTPEREAAAAFSDSYVQIPDVNHMPPAETVPMVVENLVNGTCDVITYSKLSAPKLLEVYPDFIQLEMTDAFTDSVMPDNAAIAKGQDAVLDAINEIIAGITEDDRQSMWNDCMDRQLA